MALQRRDFSEDAPKDTEEEKKAREEQERAAQEAEETRKAELEEAREARHKAEIEAATARGEAEAMRRGLDKNQAQAAQNWSDEQWEAEGAKRGVSGASLKAIAADMLGIAESRTKPLMDEIEKAKKDAAEAREEANRIKASRSRESVENSFYKKNPALAAHKDLVDDFINSYPDADRIDTKTLEKRLSFAVDIVKGKVKENMSTRRTGDTGSRRLEGGDEEERDTSRSREPLEFDPKGTGNEGGRLLMSRVNSEFGRGNHLKHSDSVEAWEKALDDEGRGVNISIDEDIELAREVENRRMIGGKRGSK